MTDPHLSASDPSPDEDVSIAGAWWASWQTTVGGREIITTQEVNAAQDGELVDLVTLSRGLSVQDGGYHWRGQLRAWPDGVLIGWYAAEDDGVESKGSLYFTLDPGGEHMIGRWVGLADQGQTLTGVGALARDKHHAVRLVTPALFGASRMMPAEDRTWDGR